MDPTSKEILERIHSVFGNLLWAYNIKDTYVDKDDPWSGILAPAIIEIISTKNRLKGYTLVQLVFGNYFILPFKYKLY